MAEDSIFITVESNTQTINLDHLRLSHACMVKVKITSTNYEIKKKDLENHKAFSSINGHQIYNMKHNPSLSQ